MWKDYSWNYIKNNRSSSISVVVAAFISALLLSLLCSLFYNFWTYEIDRLVWEEGSWQARIIGKIEEGDLSTIQKFANVERAVINEELSDGEQAVADIYFKNTRTIFKDMPKIADALGYGQEAVTYHYSLLAMYLIRSSQDEAPRAVFPFLLAVTVMACISLIMIIHNSFAVSMSSRVHQFGIFSSVGATPGQIRTCLLQEAVALCILPVIAGNCLGIAVSMWLIQGTNKILVDAENRMDAVWRYHPFLFVLTLLITIVTIWISAWIPARKMSRITPLDAIKNTRELQLKRKRKSYILPALFGIEGEIAQNAWNAQKRTLRTATIALTVSFSAFFLMQCFFTLTLISQQMTYFERYQDVWDIMVSIKNTEIDGFAGTDSLQGLPGVRSCVVYQKAMAKRLLAAEDFSEELAAAGGLQDASATYVKTKDGAWLVNAPIVILDDASFLQYCKQIGVEPQLGGAVILNRIQDWKNPNFRVRDYIPYLNETQKTTVLQQIGAQDMAVEIPVFAYTQEAPVLKEAYDELDAYVLVHFLPVSVWKEIKAQIGGADQDVCARILAKEGATLEELTALEEEILQIMGGTYEIESENRIQDKLTNDKMIDGMMLIFGGFCILLAIIGVGDVFSHTLGSVHQRRREFARYMSVGLTPGGIQKIFCMEALVMVGQPVFAALVVTAIVITLMIKAAYLNPMIFIRQMPAIPMLSFILAVFAVVALAYYLGGRKVMRSNPMDSLRDDTQF